jgi:hypothetical protein
MSGWVWWALDGGPWHVQLCTLLLCGDQVGDHVAGFDTGQAFVAMTLLGLVGVLLILWDEGRRV